MTKMQASVMADYNYATFDLPREEPVFEAFRTQLHVGTRAPLFSLEALSDREVVPMRSLWGNDRVAVLEFGSFT